MKPSSPGDLSFDISLKADDSSVTVNEEFKNLFRSSFNFVYHLFQEIQLSEFFYAFICCIMFFKTRRLALQKYLTNKLL